VVDAQIHEHGAAPRGEERTLRSRRRMSESAKRSGHYPWIMTSEIPEQLAKCRPFKGHPAKRPLHYPAVAIADPHSINRMVRPILPSQFRPTDQWRN
jgi:hypothetical protein